jgi:hypothetical protein
MGFSHVDIAETLKIVPARVYPVWAESIEPHIPKTKGKAPDQIRRLLFLFRSDKLFPFELKRSSIIEKLIFTEVSDLKPEFFECWLADSYENNVERQLQILLNEILPLQIIDQFLVKDYLVFLQSCYLRKKDFQRNNGFLERYFFRTAKEKPSTGLWI